MSTTQWNDDLRVGIFGAGAIGTFIGSKLQRQGCNVVYLSRSGALEKSVATSASHTLRVQSLSESTFELTQDVLSFSTSPEDIRNCDIVLVSTKCTSTVAVAKTLASVLESNVDCVVVSLQNGVRNQDILRQHMPQHRILAGMVGFNVVIEKNYLRLTSSGDLHIEKVAVVPPVCKRDRLENELVKRLRAAGVNTKHDVDIGATQWGKLLINLANALNALAGVPLKTFLFNRTYRAVFAASISEGLSVLSAAKIRPGKVILSPWLLPHLLRLPDWLYHLVARRVAKMSPSAKSSMLQDLEAGSCLCLYLFVFVLVSVILLVIIHIFHRCWSIESQCISPSTTNARV